MHTYSLNSLQNIYDSIDTDADVHHLQTTIQFIQKLLNITNQIVLPKKMVFDKFKKRRVFGNDKYNRVKIIKNLSNTQVLEFKSILNKITNHNYDKMIQNIDKCIEDCDDHIIVQYFELFFENVETVSHNMHVYLNLYVRFQQKFPSICAKVLDSSVEKYIKMLHHESNIDPQQDYDKFCQMEKIKTKNKNLGMFFSYMYQNGSMDSILFHKIVTSVISMLYLYIKQEKCADVVSSTSENIRNLLLDTKFLQDSIFQTAIYPKITQLANLKIGSHESYPSITNKCIFKMKDIQDSVSRMNK